MKKHLLIVGLIFASCSAFAQDEELAPIPKKATHNNEIGVDFTGLIKRNIDNAGYYGPYYSSYIPTYYVVYKRFTKFGNLRLGLGGDYSQQQVPSNVALDSNTFENKTYNYNARIGWEFSKNLGKILQVIGGVDYVYSKTYNKGENGYYTNLSVDGNSYAYSTGYLNSVTSNSIAPLLGLRCKIVQRLVISVEASFKVSFSNNSSKTYYTPQLSSSPAYPTRLTPDSKSVNTNFNNPWALILSYVF